MRLKLRPSAAVLLVGALTLGMAPMAAADSVRAQESETVREYVIIDPRNGIETEDGTFYPTEEVGPDATMVFLDEEGNLPGGLTIEGLENLLSSDPSSTHRARANGQVEGEGIVALTPELVAELNGTPPPITTYAVGPLNYSANAASWSTYSGASIWGYDDTARVTYQFTTQSGSAQVVAGQGEGWYTGYNGSQFGVWKQWYAIGVSAGGSKVSKSIAWGNRVGIAKFRAKSSNSLLANGQWWPGKN